MALYSVASTSLLVIRQWSIFAEFHRFAFVVCDDAWVCIGCTCLAAGNSIASSFKDLVEHLDHFLDLGYWIRALPSRPRLVIGSDQATGDTCGNAEARALEMAVPPKKSGWPVVMESEVHGGGD